MDNWDTAAMLTLRDNGGTFNPDGSQAFHGRGFYVGGHAAPHRCLVYNRGVIADLLRNFAWLRFPELEFEARYVGAWVARGVLYVDVTEWVPDRETAVGLCRERGELAYFDCAKGREVYV